MTITASGADFAALFQTSDSTPTATLPNDVVAGETIVLGIRLFDQTTTVTSISDPVNGTWSTGSGSNGPSDNTTNGSRTYFYYLNDSAALTGAPNRIITVNLSAAVNSSPCVGIIADSGGALTFDTFATFTDINTAITNHDTNTLSAAGAGAIVGFHTTLASSNPAADGTDESVVFNSGDDRATMFFEAYTGSGTKGFEITADVPDTANIEVAAFLEPAGAAVPKLIHNRRQQEA
jgi:hypothetical protein